jgi:hypothetical protein
MLRHVACGFILVSLIIFVGCQGGLAPLGPTPTPTPTPTGGDNNGATPTPTPTPTPGASALTIVKTGIAMHCQAKILAGDDLVVYGSGQINTNKGVNYIVPSAGDTLGRGITDGESWCSYSFAIAGKKIGLVKDDFTTAVYNTTTSTLSAILITDIRLNSINGGAYCAGNIQGDGNYFAVICDAGLVTDGKTLKVIDVSGSSPVVISFSKENLANQIVQVAVDGTAKKVAAAAADKFYIFDITTPTADPVIVENPNGTAINVQMVFKDGKILYADFNNEKMQLATVASGLITTISVDADGWDKPALIDVDMNGGKLGFFLKEFYVGINYRTAVGNVSDAPNVSKAPEPNAATKIDGSTTNNGFLAYDSTMGITPDASKIFIAGFADIGAGEYLQYSNGGVDFKLIQGTGGDAYGFPASDVSSTNNTVAFKGGRENATVVCYIKLQ